MSIWLFLLVTLAIAASFTMWGTKCHPLLVKFIALNWTANWLAVCAWWRWGDVSSLWSWFVRWQIWLYDLSPFFASLCLFVGAVFIGLQYLWWMEANRMRLQLQRKLAEIGGYEA